MIGSELRGLSRLRNHRGAYPFANHLVALAAQIRRLLPQSKISYAADWSEYGGYVPKQGVLDFPLDRFWANANCDFIGIDNYLPLSDWRDGPDHADARAGAVAITDKDYLQGNIEGGEYYDWYYADAGARDRQDRTPITDGLGKPFVYRARDIAAWWAAAHVRRRDGAETEASLWRPKSKPIWFTELGCPAVDKGANQPNIFPDTRSSEGGVPHYSSGQRDDAMQQAYLHAVSDYYAQSAHNPRSPHYDGRMVDSGQIYFWAWDARPFPAFPYKLDIWSDGGNWHNGHWLNGRDASAPLGDLLAALCAQVPSRIEPMQGAPDGFAISGPVRAIDALRPIMRGFSVDAVPGHELVRFAGRQIRPLRHVSQDDVLRQPAARRRRENGEKIKRFDLHYIDAEGDYGPSHISARHQGGDAPVARPNLPMALTQSVAAQIAERLLHETRLSGETLSLSLTARHLDLEVGDIIGYDGDFWRITRLSYDGQIALTATRHMAGLYTPRRLAAPVLPNLPSSDLVALPHVELLDLPLPAHRHDGLAGEPLPLLAAAATPWPGQVDVVVQTRRHALTGPSVMGQVLADVPAGPVGRWDNGGHIDVEIFAGSLSGLPDRDVLAGGNRLLLKTPLGWEAIQYGEAELIGAQQYRLTRLLRGQFGTEAAMAQTLPAQSLCVVPGQALLPVALGDAEAAMLRYGIAGLPEDGYSWRSHEVALAHRALACLSPVHGRVTMPHGPSGSWDIGWIRRTRLGGDDFAAPDVPLGEPQELYQARIWAGSKLISTRRHNEASFSLSSKLRKELAAGQSRRAVWSAHIAQLNAQGAAGQVLHIPLPFLSQG